MKKRMIWNNDVCSEIDTLEKDGFFAESEITSEEEKMDAAYEYINSVLSDEVSNLDVDLEKDSDIWLMLVLTLSRLVSVAVLSVLLEKQRVLVEVRLLL